MNHKQLYSHVTLSNYNYLYFEIELWKKITCKSSLLNTGAPWLQDGWSKQRCGSRVNKRTNVKTFERLMDESASA